MTSFKLKYLNGANITIKQPTPIKPTMLALIPLIQPKLDTNKAVAIKKRVDPTILDF